MSTRKSCRAKATPTPIGPTTEINIANVESMHVGAAMPPRSRADWKDWLYVVGALVGITAFVAPDLGVRAHESVVALVAPHAADRRHAEGLALGSGWNEIAVSFYPEPPLFYEPPSYGNVIPYGRSSKPTHRR